MSSLNDSQIERLKIVEELLDRAWGILADVRDTLPPSRLRTLTEFSHDDVKTAYNNTRIVMNLLADRADEDTL